MASKWVKILSLAAFAGLLYAVLHSDALRTLLHVDLKQIQSFAEVNTVWLLIAMLIIMIIQNVFTLIPLILVISSNITLFGFGYGFIWSWLTSVAGGVLVYFAARYWLKDLLTRLIRSRWKAEKMEKNSFAFVFIGRVFPFVPTSLINIASGASNVPLKHFVLGTLLGNMIYFFIMSLLAHGVIAADRASLIIAGSVCIIGFIGYLFYKKKRKSIESLDEA